MSKKRSPADAWSDTQKQRFIRRAVQMHEAAYPPARRQAYSRSDFVEDLESLELVTEKRAIPRFVDVPADVSSKMFEITKCRSIQWMCDHSGIDDKGTIRNLINPVRKVRPSTIETARSFIELYEREYAPESPQQK